MTEFALVHGTTQSPAGCPRLAAVLRPGRSGHLEINAGHCPHVSQPAALASLLAQI
jgi:hypothetical protein